MIANVFEVLARQLDAYFKTAPSRKFHSPSNGANGHSGFGGDNDPVVEIISFLRQEDKQEYIKFALNKVTPILINIEEEASLRPPDRFARVGSNGSRELIQPDIRLQLYILFVSNFYDYTDSLYYMGLIIRYFQMNPILDHQNTTGLHPDTDKLTIELVTLPFDKQNEVWNALRSAYHPSLLYKVRMLVFQDQPAIISPGEIKEVQSDIQNLS